ncbi:GNAT family N-acetyltransferase [Microbacterium saperdae]
MTDLVIRHARVEEYPAIGDLTHAAYTHDYTDLPEDYEDNLRHPERLLEEYDIWVAEQNDRVVGVVSVRHEGLAVDGWIAPDELYFRLLAVAPSARGRGIGIALVEHTIVLARQRGAANVMMNSGPNMRAAHALYRKLGFIEPPERQKIEEIDGESVQFFTFVLPTTVQEHAGSVNERIQEA